MIIYINVPSVRYLTPATMSLPAILSVSRVLAAIAVCVSALQENVLCKQSRVKTKNISSEEIVVYSKNGNG